MRTGSVGRWGLELVMTSCNFMCCPAGANPARPGGSSSEPVMSLATGEVIRLAKRRHESVWAVGVWPRNLYHAGCRAFESA